MEREGWGVSAGVRVKRRERRRSAVEESDGGMMETRCSIGAVHGGC